MASTLENEWSNYSNTVQALSVTVSEPPANRLVVVIATYFAGQSGNTSLALTNPTSVFTEAVEKAATGGFDWNMAIYYAVSNGSNIGTSIEVTHTGSTANDRFNIWVGEYSGVITSSPLDVADGLSGNGVTTSQSITLPTSGTLAQADNLVVAAFCGNRTISGETYSLPTLVQTTSGAMENGDFDNNTFVADLDISSTTAITPKWDYTSTAGLDAGVYAVFKLITSTPPVNTVPDDTAGIFTTSGEATDFGTISVAAGSETVTSITVSCVSGKGTFNFDTTGTSVTLTTNNTNSVALTTAATHAEYNTVLDTGTFTGASGIHETVTITVTTVDGVTAGDTDTFDVLNDVRTLTITTSGTYAQAVACVESLQVKMDTGETTDTITMLSTDDNTNTDTDTITVNVSTPIKGAVTRYRRRSTEF